MDLMEGRKVLLSKSNDCGQRLEFMQQPKEFVRAVGYWAKGRAKGTLQPQRAFPGSGGVNWDEIPPSARPASAQHRVGGALRPPGDRKWVLQPPGWGEIRCCYPAAKNRCCSPGDAHARWRLPSRRCRPPLTASRSRAACGVVRPGPLLPPGTEPPLPPPERGADGRSARRPAARRSRPALAPAACALQEQHGGAPVRAVAAARGAGGAGEASGPCGGAWDGSCPPATSGGGTGDSSRPRAGCGRPRRVRGLRGGRRGSRRPPPGRRRLPGSPDPPEPAAAPLAPCRCPRICCSMYPAAGPQPQVPPALPWRPPPRSPAAAREGPAAGAAPGRAERRRSRSLVLLSLCRGRAASGWRGLSLPGLAPRGAGAGGERGHGPVWAGAGPAGGRRRRRNPRAGGQQPPPAAGTESLALRGGGGPAPQPAAAGCQRAQRGPCVTRGVRVSPTAWGGPRCARERRAVSGRPRLARKSRDTVKGWDKKT
ncbi:translation initiation factor IF-2-like [Falco peregrinus]|uniref:translation initiation factor IF-2-like n=1 Tax=Falco peregrinus TaxID=8954 RepID=UPI002479206F|nr:translation initiation factor IF-2-like [Falco peregrinus]